MECNKGDAQKALEMAEKKLMEKDIVGAKKFAAMAQRLFPVLDGLSQFIATLDVHVSAEHRVNGEIDWYRVLNVAPSADDDTIRKNYRKLALMLHPDKNKSVGADGAFKILSEAWCVLCDKARRSLYDQKLNLKVLHKNFPSSVRVPSGKKGSDSFSKQKNSDARTRKSSMGSRPARHQPSSRVKTFWTICDACKIQFEYLINYRSANLLCQNCRKYFIGIEVPSPNIIGNSSRTMPFRMQQQTPVQNTRTEYSHSTENKPASEMKKGHEAHFISIVSGVTSVARGDKTKRRHIETNKPSRAGAASDSDVKGDVLKKNILIPEDRMHNITGKPVSQASHGNVGGSANVSQKTNSETGSMNVREVLPSISIRDAMINKAKNSISEMVKKWNNEAAASKNMEKGTKEKEVTRQKGDVKSRNTDAKNCQGLEDGKIKVLSKKPRPANHDDDDDNDSGINFRSMNVLDPDFHNFDEDRAEKSFGCNQVWAAYDDDDGMPRFYAKIHDVISLKPFKMKISWLNTKSNLEFSPMSWLEFGFYKTSGEFRIGKHEIYKSLNAFSHKVNWTKGARGCIHIYPKKGDVWALYRKWSPNWNELTPDEVIHQYDMVEILEDYNKDEGVTVAFLVKVAGFKTVFRQQSDPYKRMKITREEMFRLSHQIPFHLLTGEEGNNLPKGFLELDPASTPSELLQVLTETQVEELMKETKKVDDNDQPKGAGSGKEPESVENEKTSKRKTEPDDVPKNDAKKVRKNEENDNQEPNFQVYKRRP